MYGTKMTATFTSPKTGETYNIVLCVPKNIESDAKRFTEWFNDNRVKQYLGNSNGFTESAELDWLKNQNEQKDELIWMVYANEELIGSIGFHRISLTNRRAELGICIGNKKYWGKGIAAAIEIMIVDYGFNNIVAGGLHKILALVYTGNIASQKVLEQKVGFRSTGIRKENVWCNGGWYDEWSGELLKSGWKEKRTVTIKNAGITELSLYPGCNIE